MNRIERGVQKLETRFIKEAKRWARKLGVKQKGMDIDDLKRSFQDEGFTLNSSRMGSELEMWVLKNSNSEVILQGTISLDIDYRKDTPVYEGD